MTCLSRNQQNHEPIHFHFLQQTSIGSGCNFTFNHARQRGWKSQWRGDVWNRYYGASIWFIGRSFTVLNYLSDRRLHHGEGSSIIWPSPTQSQMGITLTLRRGMVEPCPVMAIRFAPMASPWPLTPLPSSTLVELITLRLMQGALLLANGIKSPLLEALPSRESVQHRILLALSSKLPALAAVQGQL